MIEGIGLQLLVSCSAFPSSKNHHMDLVVVAEGVEKREQQQDLIRRDCDLLQGFLFARPMPLGDLMAKPERLPADE